MLSEIAYFPLFGKPLILYMGIITLLLFITTVSIGLMIFKRRNIPFKIHPTMASIAIITGVIHGTLGVSIYLLG